MKFALTKTEKTRRVRRVREFLQQYARMQDPDTRKLYPDWFKVEGEALDSARILLYTLIQDHEREERRRVMRDGNA